MANGEIVRRPDPRPTNPVPIWFGFNPPFIGGQQKVMSRQEDLRLIKNDLIQLLLTAPGERVHRPTFGSPIRQTVFDPADDVMVDNLIPNIQDVIREEEPRLTNVQVFMVLKKDDLQLEITVTGAMTNDPSVKFELEVNLPFSAGAINPQEVSATLDIGNGSNTGPLSTRTL